MPYLHEWCFDLTSGAVRESQISPIPCEFPRINETYTGRKMRYGYAGKVFPGSIPLFNGVIKFDLAEGTAHAQPQIHQLGESRYCGEPVFAPRPGGIGEDDGWLLIFVHDEGTNQSELLILDAQNLEAAPVARVLIPQRVPYGFHGAWVSQAQYGH